MRKNLIITFLCLIFWLPINGTAASVTEVYIFGDSLSDDGNLYEKLQLPPSPPYSQAFTNGAVWPEYFVPRLGIAYNSDTNFAFGGARSDDTSTMDIVAPGQVLGLSEQLDHYFDNYVVDPDALYIVMAGTNDFLDNLESMADTTDFAITDPAEQVANSINNLMTAVTRLYQQGAKNIVLSSLPQAGLLPSAVRSDAVVEATALMEMFQQNLQTAITQLPFSILFFNLFEVHENGVSSSGMVQHGFTNVTDPCLDVESYATLQFSICDNPDQYFYWDMIHPSTRAHQVVADEMYQLVSEAFAPTQTNCENQQCSYTMALEETGFYVNTVDLADNATEGLFSASVQLEASINFGGFHVGAVLPANGTQVGFATFSLQNDSPIDFTLYELSGQVSQLELTLYRNEGSKTQIRQQMLASGGQFSTETLTAGDYLVEIKSRLGDPRSVFALSVMAEPLAANVNYGGLVDGISGEGFLAFYTAPYPLSLNVYFGDNFGAAGASQLSVQVSLEGKQLLTNF